MIEEVAKGAPIAMPAGHVSFHPSVYLAINSFSFLEQFHDTFGMSLDNILTIPRPNIRTF
jgi:hypothetical protein